MKSFIKSKAYLLVLILALALLPGCFSSCLSSFFPKTEEKQANLKDKELFNNIKAKDFDLGAIVSLIKQNKVKDMAALEKVINSDQNAINNIDTDKDGKVDYIVVREQKNKENNKNMNFEFFAKPNKDAEPVKIANIDFEIGPKKINIAGNYDENLSDSDKAYRTTVVNNHGPSWGQMFFFSWLMTPNRSMFYQSHYPSHYRPHTVYPDRVVQQKRQRYARASGLGRVSSYAKSKSPTKKPGFFKSLGKTLQKRKSSGFKPKFRGFRGFRRR